MNHKEIFEEYTQASNKVKYIKEKAKALGVYDSDIICELFKSGFKFEELKRANKATYNAGIKKYEKWKENGSLDGDAPEVEEEKPVYDYPPDDSDEPAGELSLEMKQLMDENCQLKAELSQLKAEKAEDSEVMNEHIKANKRMMERIDELQVELNEATQNYNEVMIMYQKLEKDNAVDTADLETAHRILADEYRKNDELTKKLETAERYILDKIYADYEKEKNTNAG